MKNDKNTVVLIRKDAKRRVEMSIVIVGGNECMECKYTSICKEYGHRAKVFTKENGSVARRMGCPDLLILFTNTVSHKMVISATKEAKRLNVPITRLHNSSSSALHGVLAEL